MASFRHFVVVLAVLVSLTLGIACTPAVAQSTAATGQSGPSAYDIAIKCFVVTGLASRTSRQANDQPHADYYNEKSETAFNVATGLGKVLGYSKDRIDADIGTAMKSELPRLMDATYFQKSAAECRAYQLM